MSYLVGRKFAIMTDNRALQFLKNKDLMTGCLARWMDTLRDMDFEVKHHPGSSNGNADGLSRQAWSKQDASCEGGGMLGFNIVKLT